MEKKPAVRFKGFADEWEQRKLGDVAVCLDNMRVPLNAEEREKIPGDIPYYGAGNIQGYINKHLFEEDLVLLLEDGDAFDDYQTKSIAQYVTGKSWVNNHAHVLRPLGDAYFLYSTLAHKDIRQWTQLAGASRKKLVQEAMLNIDIAIPTEDEQNKVGAVFRELDNLIALYQRKCDNLKEVKKYMLQKMFPKNGEKVPEIRFAGFTGDWEQRKFGDFAQRQSESRMSDNDVPSVEYEDVVAGQGILNKELRNKEVNKTGIVFSEEDVLYGKLRPYLHNWLNPDFRGVAVGDWWVLKPQDMDKNFLYRLIQTPQFDDAANQSSGTKMPRADWKLISNLKFRVPNSIEEQAKIGKHFNNLDTLIALYQRKCDNLKEVKKYMLQNMFA